jgi:TolB protein
VKVLQYSFDLYVAAAENQPAIRVTHNMDLMLSQPVWSPDATQIAVVGQASGDPDIYLVSVEGMTSQNLTMNPKDDTDPQWSPAGDRIAFVSNRRGNEDIYIVKSDGTDVLQLTNTSARDASPRWSPDGKQIAFVEYVLDTANIYLITADGSERQLVVSLQVNPDPTIEIAWQP